MVRFAANLSFLFKELPFLERFRASAAARFAAVEFMFPGDGGYVHTAAEVQAELMTHSLEQVLINAPAGAWEDGERGIGGIADREAEWMASIDTGIQCGLPPLHRPPPLPRCRVSRLAPFPPSLTPLSRLAAPHFARHMHGH